MDIVIYKAKIKSGYLYDMSFNPSVDYEILRTTRNIEGIEVMTPFIPFEKGEEILRKIYGKSIFKTLVPSMTHDIYIKKGMKKIKLNSQNAMLNENSSAFVDKRKSKDISINVDIGGERNAGEHTYPSKYIDMGIKMPSSEDISNVESCITGKVVPLRSLFEISGDIGLSIKQITDIVQILYCERRIKIVPSVKKVRGKLICSFCEKVACNECCMDFRNDDVLLYAADNYNIGIPRPITFKKKKMNDCLSKAVDGLNNFVESNKKHNATLWCVPNSFEFSILAEPLSKVISKGGKLLFVTSSLSLSETEQELSNIFEGVSISIVDRHTLKYKDIDITLCSYNDYPCFHKAFDLVVLDERMIYIDKTLKNILSICKRAVKENGRLIHITHLHDPKSKENMSSANELITIPVNNSRSPIPEPLIVISRLLKESIPEMVIDTINWSMKENHKMLIFVPNDEIRINFYDRLLKLMDINRETIGFSTAKEKTSILKLKKKELQVVISNDLKDATAVIDDLNVIVMNADDETYSTELLLNMSAMAVYHTKKKCGQVIFVVEKDCDTVTKSKESIRGINKIAWENGYIKK